MAVKVKNISMPLNILEGEGNEKRSSPFAKYVNAPEIRRAIYGSDRQS
jgi:hypothetical protein